MSDYLTYVMHTSDFVDRNEIETAYIVLYKTQPLLYHLPINTSPLWLGIATITLNSIIHPTSPTSHWYRVNIIYSY